MTAPSDVPKPGMPPLLATALAAWASCAAAYTLLEPLPHAASWALAAAGAAAALALGVLMARGGRFFLLCVALGAALGICCAGCGAGSLKATQAQVAGDVRAWTFTLAEDAASGSYGAYALAYAQDEAGARVKVRLSLDEGCSSLMAGSRLEATCALEEPSEASRGFSWSQGVCATARPHALEQIPGADPLAALRWVRARAVEALGAHGGEQAGILQALACGYRNTIEESGGYEAYKTVGLAHLVAVSGAHLALVTAMLAWVLGALRCPRLLRLALVAGMVAAYLVLAGVPLSAVRAAVMALLSLLAPALRRRASSLSALAVCVMAFVALDASASVSVSFFLSAASTLGIVAFAPLVSSWLAPLPRALRGPLAQPLALTAASNLVTLPFSAALFSQLPLIAPVANVLATPLFTIACVTSLLAGLISCALPAAAPIAVLAARAAAFPLEGLVSLLAHVPYACVAVSLPVLPMIALSAGAASALWLAWPAMRLRVLAAGCAAALAATAAVVLVAPAFCADEIIMLDVGQGDAFVVRSRGASVLVDTGNQDALLREALGRNGVYALDALVVSHADDDHCGSMDALGGVAAVRRVCVAADALACPCGSCERLRAQAVDLAGEGSVVGLRPGDALAVGRFTLKVVWPHEFADEGGNADSLCVLATLDSDGNGAGDWTALFCGDAESDQLERIVDEQGVRGVDVLKVGHHGARVALTDELARALSPRIALVSCGKNNRYGHPSDETLARLADVGARVVRTDQTGDAKLTFDEDSVSVAVEHPV